MARLRVEWGDITTLAVDAVVNAANEGLLGGGGVDGALHEAAGPALLGACLQLPEVQPGVRCPAGEARITPGFRLPARFVIHTVGPVWRGGSAGECEMLASCYAEALALCPQHGIRTIAIPAISCGAFGFPPDAASDIAVRTIHRSLDSGLPVESVVLVAMDRHVHSALARAVASDPDL